MLPPPKRIVAVSCVPCRSAKLPAATRRGAHGTWHTWTRGRPTEAHQQHLACGSVIIEGAQRELSYAGPLMASARSGEIRSNWMRITEIGRDQAECQASRAACHAAGHADP